MFGQSAVGKRYFESRVEPPEPGSEIIRLEGVHKAFGSLTVFDGIDIAFRHGETAVVLGRSGTGKSVLLKHIIGIMKPDRGRVIVLGHDLAEMSKAELEPLRLHFGMLFQGSALFDSMDVDANVGFALYEHTDRDPEEIRRIVSEKLAMVGLEGIEHMVPEELSGGMKKRVALARAIAMDPHIILFDEPTTGLDPVSADMINDLIIKIHDELKATCIMVTHDIASAKKVGDRILMLYEGKIIADDTPEGMEDSDDPRVQAFIRGDASLQETPEPSGDQP